MVFGLMAKVFSLDQISMSNVQMKLAKTIFHIVVGPVGTQLCRLGLS